MAAARRNAGDAASAAHPWETDTSTTPSDGDSIRLLLPPPPSPEPDPPDLAPAARPLSPQFPMEPCGTDPARSRVVLYDAGPGAMRARWSLARADFERARTGFPHEGRAPAAVVRLRRDRPEGGSEPVDERPLGLATREGEGEAGFHLEVDHRRYRVELGLSDGEGGWLMLARSNGLHNAHGIGPRLPGRPVESRPGRGPAPPAARPGNGTLRLQSAPPADAAAPAARHPPEAVPEPALVGTPLNGTAFPLVQLGRATAEAASRLGSDRGVPSSGADRREGGPLPMGVVAARRPVPAQSEGAPAEPAGGGGARPPFGGPAGGPAHTDGIPPPIRPPGPAATAPGPPEGPPNIGVPIAPPSYRGPPERPAGLDLEAELRIHGRAPPGSEVDLFGRPYRVGPGGRFQLVLRVEDAELLRRALDLAPPPELTTRRDA